MGWPRWRTVLMVLAALLVSGAGWIGYGCVVSAQLEAQRLAAVAHAEARDADLQTLDGNEGRALAWLVVYRCDHGTITDGPVCDQARKILR